MMLMIFSQTSDQTTKSVKLSTVWTILRKISYSSSNLLSQRLTIAQLLVIGKMNINCSVLVKRPLCALLSMSLQVLTSTDLRRDTMHPRQVVKETFILSLLIQTEMFQLKEKLTKHSSLQLVNQKLVLFRHGLLHQKSNLQVYGVTKPHHLLFMSMVSVQSNLKCKSAQITKKMLLRLPLKQSQKTLVLNGGRLV